MRNIADRVFELVRGKRNGFYIESGANDGKTGSPTFRLEKELGWRGILLDASPQAMSECQKNRSSLNIFVTAALTSKENEGKVLHGNWNGDPRGNVNGETWPIMHPALPTIPAVGVTMGSILRKSMVNEVDLWILDLEGHELFALKGMDWQWCKPKQIVVEVHGTGFDPMSQTLANAGELVQYMREVGYYATENVSQFDKKVDVSWSGNHQDILFERCGDVWA